jgi:hypothetical protein
MGFLMDNRIDSFALVKSIAIILSTGAITCPAQQRDSIQGELKLEGGHIEQIVLRRDDGRTEKFDKPEEIIKLPIGEYQLQQVGLVGGYTCRTTKLSRHNWIKVVEDKPTVLQVGAPLKQTVRVKRQGRVLVLDYKLVGIGGNSYAGGDRSKPPSFTVYKNDQIIDSDKFQYG